MTISDHDLAVALALLVAFTALLAVAPRLRVPYPILLVLGGLALGFAPGVPEIQIPPQVVLFGILPPLLYSAAFFTSLRDLRANKRPIGLLSTGLVLCEARLLLEDRDGDAGTCAHDRSCGGQADNSASHDQHVEPVGHARSPLTR